MCACLPKPAFFAEIRNQIKEPWKLYTFRSNDIIQFILHKVALFRLIDQVSLDKGFI